MSIYQTLWVIKLEKRGISKTRDGNFVEVWAQAVPAHIGQPSEGYEDGDPYASFLPPVITPYDPDREDHYPYRAVVILQKGRMEKDGQKYVDPVMTITGEEYEKIPFPELLAKIYRGLKIT